MKIEEVEIRSFRNISHIHLRPSGGINLFLGSNAQGKTSVLEAIALLGTLRSFRTHRLEELIQHGQPHGEVHCRISRGDSDGIWSGDLKICLEGHTKRVFVNGKVIRSSSEFLGQKISPTGCGFHSITFHPADHQLIRGNPETRRHYMDQVIASETPGYLESLSRYHRILQQRNSVLKSGNSSLLPEFTEAMVHFGAKIAEARLHWLRKLEPEVKKHLGTIAPQQKTISIRYFSSWIGISEQNSSEKISNFKEVSGGYSTGQEHLPSIQQLEQDLGEKARRLHVSEWEAQMTLFGPHRDDWGFLLGGQPLKTTASQGEVRSVLLALKLAEVELFKEATGLSPVLMVDDFSSELDSERRKFLFSYLERSGLQVFVTATESPYDGGCSYIVESGNLRQRSQEERNGSKLGLEPIVGQ